MFPDFDPDKKPPYVQYVYEEIDGVTYVTKYLVSNGYGGSISVSCGPKYILKEGVADEKRDT